MAEISASSVMKLRQMSGQGMMDCKKALSESNGDIDKAVEILRKKGLATLAKRAERETTQGIVITKSGDDGKKVVLASLCCETDFVAKSEDFIAAANALAEYAMVCSEKEGVENILKTGINGKTYNELLTDIVSKTGEKTEVGDFTRYELEGPGLIATYIHFNSKVGTMVQIDASDDNVAASGIIKQAATDIAMHITASKPLALDKDGIDPEIIQKEKDIITEQIKNKPPEIVEKIVEGKIRKYYAENCLLSQPFVKDDSKTVEKVISEAAKQAGGQAKIARYVRFEVG